MVKQGQKQEATLHVMLELLKDQNKGQFPAQPVPKQRPRAPAQVQGPQAHVINTNLPQANFVNTTFDCETSNHFNATRDVLAVSTRTSGPADNVELPIQTRKPKAQVAKSPETPPEISEEEDQTPEFIPENNDELPRKFVEKPHFP